MGNKPADPLYRLLCTPYFYRLHRYLPNFTRPRSFTEVVWNRMFFDRDPRLRLLSDKFTFRSYVSERVDPSLLVPILWHGSDPDAIPFGELPERYVLKASHGSGYNLIVTPERPRKRKEVQDIAREWISRDYCLTNCVGSEWAYQGLKPTLLIEPFLVDEKGDPPPDFKFYCFHGTVRILQIDYDRAAHHTRSMHDRTFQRLNVRFTYPDPKNIPEKPANFELMVRLAEVLAADLPLVRVDFYNLGARIIIGEMTNYPGGGRMKIHPRSFDQTLADELCSRRRRPSSVSEAGWFQ